MTKVLSRSTSATSMGRTTMQRDHNGSPVQAAVEFIRSIKLFQPQVAIILGSGLGGLADDVQHATAIPYGDIPNFKRTHATGHAGQLLLGYVSGIPAVVMQGRCHRYEDHTSDTVTFPVRVMAALGAKTLLVTNAAGGLNPRYRVGDLMIVDQHIHWLWNRPLVNRLAAMNGTALNGTTPSDLRASHIGKPTECPSGVLGRTGEIYDHQLGDQIRAIGLEHRIHLQRGTYVATLGPTYETRAEYRMFRWMGGDAVGMSTVPEALTARELGLRVLALSVITNVACTDSAHGTSHDEVVECGKQVEPRLRKLVGGLLEQMAGPAD